ncbi:PstS family phosphate ABC transporter substrate-binding protein [Petrocella sp. FN5]|uniref:PstS family phosphate ABC transporter substrate-binding protein n=1 Tax=Petrocella sp. FN5 TaxID=3032002 RepID=UPI0023DCB9AC|nr:substrate-binding domain-containing protein [Petrocella sp. FN5]MDF1617879.1 substrate-binding domain-containing protein [Petrocella sp. FN5]
MYSCKRYFGHVVFVILLTLSLGFLSACTASNSKESQAPSFDPETYPRVDGSTVTIPLSEALAGRLMGMTLDEVRPYILHNKTHQAYVNLIDQKTDLIFVTSPSKEELDLAASMDVTLEVIPIVSEAFVFLAHVDNPVDSLTYEEIRSIYAGEITNWSQVGGANLPIVAYQRPLNSGSQTGFLELVMKDKLPMEPPSEQIIAGMSGLIDAVAAYESSPDALGYSYYYFVVDMWGNDDVRLLKVDGVYPSPETIASKEYPVGTAYYAVIRSDEPKDSPARQVIEWLLSDEGQLLAKETGYVPLQ